MLAERAVTVPSLESAEVQAAWEAADAEQAYWDDHYESILAEHPDQFVAVKDHEVVATAKDLPALLGTLAGQNIAASQVWVRYVTADPHRLMP